MIRQVPWTVLVASMPFLLCLGYAEEKTPEAIVTKAPAAAASSLADLSIEDLMNIKITSVSKKEEKASETASAIYVITQEDIRRSGVTTIADALRMVPGVNVAQGNAHTFAISVRGFQSGLANKLLVLIDGRSVYTPLYSGVYWDVQDTLLEDIERIEVIRGPGATVWGANAVNGVINIITKHSKNTKGLLAVGSVGTSEVTNDSIRYGGKIGEKVTYRVFLKYAKRQELSLPTSGLAAHDGWEIGRAGTRFDIQASPKDALVIEGDYYNGMFEEKPPVAQLTPPLLTRPTNDARMSGGDALARWSHTFSETSDFSLQAYYDRTERQEVRLGQAIDTIDLDFSHHLKLPRNEIVYGIGYRHVALDIDNTFTVQFLPAERKTDLFSAFVQDEITVLKDTFYVTIGSKFEHNDFSGFEVQPSIKALWRAAKDHSVWASVSRAVRTPSPLETDLRANLLAVQIPFGPLALFSLFPNHDISSETEVAYELGYRARLHKRFSLDAAGFFNDYHNLRSNELGAFFVELNPPPPHLTVPITQEADVKGETYGGELAATWEPIDRLKISGGYSYLKILLHKDRSSNANDAEAAEGQTPHHQFNLRAFLNLPHNLQFDTSVYFVDRLQSLSVSSYTRVDVRLGWRPTRNIDVSIGGQNLMRHRHEEFAPEQARIERNLYAKLTLSW